MKFVFITVSAPAIRCLMKAADEIALAENGILDLRLYYGVTECSKAKKQRLIDDIADSDMEFVDLMGSHADVIKAVY